MKNEEKRKLTNSIFDLKLNFLQMNFKALSENIHKKIYI